MGKLLATPEEERERIAYLTEIAKRERANAVIIDKLETELKEKIEDKDREVCSILLLLLTTVHINIRLEPRKE